jgi:hypothetical protein
MPDLTRDAEQDATSSPLLIISDSHATRLVLLAEASDPATLGVMRPGWRASKIAVEIMVAEIVDFKERITKDHVAVLQLVDNVAYHALTNEDNVIPCRKDITGNYHVD